MRPAEKSMYWGSPAVNIHDSFDTSRCVRDECPQEDHKAHHRYQSVYNGRSRQPKTVPNSKKYSREDAQRLQTLDARLGRERARHKREDRRPSLAKAGNPPDSAGEEPRGKNAAGVVHDERIDRPEENADERDRDCAAEERRHEPDDQLQTAHMHAVSMGVLGKSSGARTQWRPMRRGTRRASRQSFR